MTNIELEHPEYALRKAMWRKYRDLYVGGEQLKARAADYLAQRQKEPVDVYAERLHRAVGRRVAVKPCSLDRKDWRGSKWCAATRLLPRLAPSASCPKGRRGE